MPEQPDWPDHNRDYVGYGEQPPPGHWPGTQARVAISLVINVEDGAERAVHRGDPVDDTSPHWISDLPNPDGSANPALESAFDYGARAGIWRVLRVLDAHQVTFTAFACGRALELNPAIATALAARDAEIVDHGLLWEPHADLVVDELKARMDESDRLIHAMAGTHATSWYSKDGHSPASLRLMRERQYQHDSNCFCEDMPHLTGRPDGLVSIPYAADTNDALLLRAIATGAQFEAQLRSALETLREDPRPGVRVLSVGMHPRWIGRPAYAGALQRFIGYANTLPDVMFARRDHIAAWWRSMVGEQGTPARDLVG